MTFVKTGPLTKAETDQITQELSDAIYDAAEQYFRHAGATDSNAMQLSDQVFGALSRVESEEAFDRDFVPVVERAFNRLRLLGYRCEQDWECCMTCGWDAIPWEDADQAVWYHRQDRDGAIKTGTLLLTWTGDAAVIRECLEAEGLLVDHDGDAGTRIRVALPEKQDATAEA